MDGFHGSAVPDGEMRAPRVSFNNIMGRRAGVSLLWHQKCRAEITKTTLLSKNSMMNETDEMVRPFLISIKHEEAPVHNRAARDGQGR